MPSDRLRHRLETSAGRFEKTGIRRHDWRDPYYVAISVRWPLFLAALALTWLAINVLFALLYLRDPDAIANAAPGSFLDDFFFSIETLATVGYGVMAPKSRYGHVVSALEIFTGTLLVAVMTGLVFVRFAKPRARILYAQHAVVARHNGAPTLMLRIGNGRPSPLIEANARLTALIYENSAEGQSFRRAYDLPLARPSFPLFALTWTIMHTLGADSPLARFDAQSLREARVLLLVTVSAQDPALGTAVYDVHRVEAEQVLFGMRYADAITVGALATRADMARFSAVVADGGDPAGGG